MMAAIAAAFIASVSLCVLILVFIFIYGKYFAILFHSMSCHSLVLSIYSLAMHGVYISEYLGSSFNPFAHNLNCRLLFCVCVCAIFTPPASAFFEFRKCFKRFHQLISLALFSGVFVQLCFSFRNRITVRE